MKLFGSRPPADVVSSLEQALGRSPRVLAHGSGPDVVVLVLDDALAVRRGQDWALSEWYLVQSGGWKADRHRLEWQLADQTSHSAELTEPGRVPETFQERVNASIVVQQSFDVPGGGRVMIAGRRSLARGKQSQPVVWQALTRGAAKLSDPQVRDFVLETTAALRADYEL